MTYKYQYATQEEREQLIAENSDKYLIEEHNITEGNFLIFSDERIPIKPVYVVEENLVNELNSKIVELESDNLIALEALAEVYEMVLGFHNPA